jgi:DNA-binding response OmpR family regulator
MATLQGIWDKAEGVRRRISQTCEPVAAGSWDSSGRVIAVGDFRIDVGSRSATVRGRELHLSGAEFDVLVFLIDHRKRLVTSSTLLSTRPDADSTRVSRTEFLRVLLSLRKKLEAEVPGNQYIQTEAWILYDFHPGI